MSSILLCLYFLSCECSQTDIKWQLDTCYARYVGVFSVHWYVVKLKVRKIWTNGVMCTYMDSWYLTGTAEPKLLKHSNQNMIFPCKTVQQHGQCKFFHLNNFFILKKCFRFITRSFNSICGIVLITTIIIANEKQKL